MKLVISEMLLTVIRERVESWRGRSHTRQIPGLTLVEVDFRYCMYFEISVQQLPCKIVTNELFVCRVETETWWEPCRLRLQLAFLISKCSDIVAARLEDRHENL